MYQLGSEDNFTDPTEIIENKLWIGSIKAAKDFEKFKEIQFTGVLNCSDGITNYFQDFCDYLNINVEDKVETNLSFTFEEAHEFINSHEKVLVHCKLTGFQILRFRRCIKKCNHHYFIFNEI
jgi:hypothetical protein